jgi:hypothetical protein
MTTDQASAVETLTPTVRSAWRSARAPVLIGVAIVVVGTVLGLLARGSQAGYLDPDAVDDLGARALRVLLEQQGVEVVRAETADAAVLALARAGPEVTLFVTIPDLVRAEQVGRLRDLPQTTVLVGSSVTEEWVAGVEAAGEADVEHRDPSCAVPVAERAGDADLGGTTYRAGGDLALDAVGCYPAGGRPSLLFVPDGARTSIFIGAAAPFTNDRLDDRGNAALATGLLGQHQTLVWYLPSAADLTTDGGSLTEQLPDWVPWVLAQLAIGVVVLAIWRARRLGPLVPEPLPVVVRAAEATEGRARLLRKSGGRDRAAQRLREGSVRRLGPLVGLPRGAAPDAVVDAVAARAQQPPTEVRALLYGAFPGEAPPDDAALVRLADGLDALEREVRRL